jgi:hypothetical protein
MKKLFVPLLVLALAVTAVAFAFHFAGNLGAAGATLALFTLPSLVASQPLFGMVYQNATAAPREELSDIIMEGVTDFDEFQGLALLPAKPMNLPTGHVPKITIAKGDLMRATTRVRTPGSNFTRWQSAIDDLSITLIQTPEEVQLPDEQTLLYEDYFAFEQVYAAEAANRLRRGHELDCADAIFDATVFDAVASTVAYTAANAATNSFVDDVTAAIRRCKGRGERPNTIQIPGMVYDRIRTATKVREFIAGANQPGSVVAPNTLQRAFAENGIKQVLISDGYVNQSEALQSDVLNPIWPNTYVFVGNCQGGELRAGGIGRTMFWDKEGPLFNISSYRDEPKKSNVIRAQKTTLCAITNLRAGTLITTQYA